MSTSFSNVYVEPGAYPLFRPTTNFPVIPGGLRVPAIIGKGTTYNTVTNEALITTGIADALSKVAISLTKVIDENYVVYTQGADYSLGSVYNYYSGYSGSNPVEYPEYSGVSGVDSSGGIVWATRSATVTGTATSFSGLSTNTFAISVNGGALQTITFGSITTIADIVSYVNLHITGVTAEASSGALKLTTILTQNSSITIGAGTANTILGFTSGQTYLGSKAPVVGKTIYVSYTYNKLPADYAPAYFFNMNDVITYFGQPDADNTLSLGCLLAFQNGAQVVLACQLDPSITSDLMGFRDALDKLKKKDCNIVVAMTGDKNIFPYIQAHVNQMSTLLERKFRTAIIGLDGSPSYSDITPAGQGIVPSNRIMIVYPPTVRLYDYTGTEISVGGYAMAAAIAGVRCNPAYDVAEPLVWKPLIGFTEITDGLLNAQKNQMAQTGICIVDTLNGVIKVRDDLTTDQSTVENSTYSITEITDYVGIVSFTILQQMFTGTKILPETPALVASTQTVILANLMPKIINNKGTVTATQSTVNSTEIDVAYSFKPTYPCKYIFIQYSIATA